MTIYDFFFSNHLLHTPAQSKVSAQNSPHQPDLHFLMRKDLYFHVGYATKIKFGASHNINFSKTKMPRSGAPTIDDFTENLGIAHVKVSLKIMAGN